MPGHELEAVVGEFIGVIDWDLSDLPGDPNRMTAAAMHGVPQVIVPGGLDRHSLQELDRIGREIAHKACASRGPTSIYIPTAAWTDAADVPAESVRVLSESLRSWLMPSVRLEVVVGRISDREFALRAWSALSSGLRR